MNVAFIQPPKWTHITGPLSNTHMVLGHIYEVNEAYRNYYKERAAEGDIILLDNSAYELGTGISDQRFFDMIQDLNPNYIFLPDVRFDEEATIEATEAFVDAFPADLAKPEFLCVPQGNDFESVLDCYLYFSETYYCDGFGLYEEIGDVTDLGDRSDFCKYLEDQHLVDFSKYYHMLGMEEDLHKLVDLAKFDWISSIDSVKPIVYGMNGIPVADSGYVPYPHRPIDYFDRDVDENTVDLVEVNCRLARSWAR